MKTMRYSLAMLMFFMASLYGQQAGMGLMIAGNSSNWYGTDAGSFEKTLEKEMKIAGMSGNLSQASCLNFSAGVFYRIPVSRVISIQPEVNYVQRGSKLTGTTGLYFEGDSYDLTTDIVFMFDYIEIPFLFQITTASKGDRFSIYGGPAFSYLLSSKFKVKVSVDGESEQETEDLPGFQENDFGYIVGAAVAFSNNAIFGVRYSRGTRTILPESDICNKAITLYIGGSL